MVGAKNSVLKLMAAALLAEGRTEVTNIPRILDVTIMSEVLRRLGCDVVADGDTLVIDVPAEPRTEADYDLVRQLRASICVLGPLLTRCGHVKVALPGGDAIGSRGLDMHIAGLERMGAEITNEHGFVIASVDRLRGADIVLEFPSVGATENIVTAAVLAKGTTVIDNAAREPEIVDICAMLSAMGAQIDGAGTSTIVVDGVDALRPVTHRTVGDRIVAGTWAFAAAMTRGDVTVRGADPAHLDVVLEKLASTGAEVTRYGTEGFRVAAADRPRAVDVVTLPYPGFPTDLLAPAIALGTVAEGASMVTENVFDARFMFVNELARLGADARTDGHHAVVRGKHVLSGAPVRATDIRAGAALVLAGLCADGVTEVADVHHIDRGYPDFVPQLESLGADVRRVTVPDVELPPAL
ncbi:MAG: UDP-N-acetylglucosamine 1-carboxyvinyltransferase [Actinomycetota bacterium]|nr:UDP-N-acetylglucosamine 1-carboxyvinyltransferase [Cryptosporangiaceae bacterium]MDQ1678938.1 UDP-N-acetylglucosamine 1-carboxyvinyltransferase [Actinomycetota bacterium]